MCAEYCFQCCSNPSQQDSPFDENVHHRDALLTALSNSCGGLVLLTTAEETPRKTTEFSTFPSLSSSTYSENVETSQLAVPGNVWCVRAAKKSSETSPYQLDGGVAEFEIDIQGKLWYAPHSGEQPGRVDNPAQQTEQRNPKTDVDPDDDATEAFQPPTKKPQVDTVGSPEPPVVVSELNWDQNKVNWWNILQETEESIEKCIKSCDFLEPHIPMKLMPDKDSLRYLFPSDATCDETLHKLATKEPGFAIASRSWLSLLPEGDRLQPPSSHLCDILTVSKGKDSKPSICLWVVVSGSKEQIIHKQVQYMFVVGRSIKHQITDQSREMPNLTIRCMLHSTNEEDNSLIEKTLHESGIQKTQDFLTLVFLERQTFDAVKRGIAQLLLSQKSHINNCTGEQLSVKLSERQAETLLEMKMKIKRKRVWYVSSAPGTGKTICGLSLYKDVGKEHSVYISPTKPLVQYLRYNECEATLVRNDVELQAEMKKGTFSNKQLVIIDESHHLRCSKQCLKELFLEVKKHKMSLFVFADNEFQSFDRENQRIIERAFTELSNEVLGYYPNTHSFTEMYRNPRKIVSFLQHAIEEPDQDITCGNPSDGEGIQAIALENLWDNSRTNGLVQYIRPLLVLPGSSEDGKYLAKEVAVLLDSGHSASHVDTIGHILDTQLSPIAIQASDMFPRKGIIVDKIDSFVGLDAPLCIFLLSAEESTNSNERIDNMRYRVFLASRATQKAVFVVSKIDTELIQCLKFDRFPVSTQFLCWVMLMMLTFSLQFSPCNMQKQSPGSLLADPTCVNLRPGLKPPTPPARLSVKICPVFLLKYKRLKYMFETDRSLFTKIKYSSLSRLPMYKYYSLIVPMPVLRDLADITMNQLKTRIPRSQLIL